MARQHDIFLHEDLVKQIVNPRTKFLSPRQIESLAWPQVFQQAPLHKLFDVNAAHLANYAVQRLAPLAHLSHGIRLPAEPLPTCSTTFTT
jgi:hypothetical protein